MCAAARSRPPKRPPVAIIDFDKADTGPAPCVDRHGKPVRIRRDFGAVRPRLAKLGSGVYRFIGVKKISPLGLYKGRRTITWREWKAGMRYEELFHWSQAELGRLTSSYQFMPKSGKAPGPPTGGAYCQQQLDRIDAVLGGDYCRIVRAVCIDGIDVVTHARQTQWRKPDDALAVLRRALAVLADQFKVLETD